MKRLIASAIFAVVMVLPACRETPSGHVVGTGTIHPSIGECGAWFVRADLGREYPLTGLAAGFQHSGLRVRFTLKKRGDIAGTCMAGEIADVVSMTKL